MEYLFIYLLQIVEVLQNVIKITNALTILCTVAFTVIWVVNIMDGEECLKRACKSLKPVIITTVTLSLLLMLIPTKQTLLLVGGLYLGKQTAQKLELNSKIDKVNTIISLELDKRIKELSSASSNEH